VQIEFEIYQFMLQIIAKDSKLAMQGLWGAKIPKLKLRVYQLDRLLRWHFPRLHAHFAAISLSPEILTAQWFITLFAYNFPVDSVLKIWDYIFLTGWEGVCLFSVCLFSVCVFVCLSSVSPLSLRAQFFVCCPNHRWIDGWID
jgi:hypothetical protein